MSVYKPFDDSVGSISKGTSYADDDTISLRSMSSRASKLRRKVNKKSLSEPLTEEKSVDPFYVFRDDLYRKLELVDEGLAEYLRVVHETVSGSVCNNIMMHACLWVEFQARWLNRNIEAAVAFLCPHFF